MSELPSVGTRVAVRFRLPAGSEPPLSDAVGHLLAVAPMVRVRTKTGEVVEFAPGDVLTVRRLTDVPVRNSQIRAVEHAAALAFPGIEHRWLDGWLLRAGVGDTFRANSAIPLELGASFASVPAIVDFYVERGLTPLFAIPDRLVSMRDDTTVERENRTLVAELPATLPPRPDVALADSPGPDWLAGYDRDVAVAELAAVLDGRLCFAVGPAGAVARAAITAAPDGTRWVGISDVHVDAGQRRRGQASAVCAALLAWAVEHGATHGYAHVRDGDDAALGLFAGLGFAPQHRFRYVRTEAIWVDPGTRRR